MLKILLLTFTDFRFIKTVKAMSFLALFCFNLLRSNAAENNTNNVNPGEVLFIQYSNEVLSENSVKLGQTKVVRLTNTKGNQFIAGVDINTIYGDYILTIDSKKEQLDKIPYSVNKAKVYFTDTEEPLLKNSKEVLKKLLWSNRTPQLPLQFPAQGEWSDNFGNYVEMKLETVNGSKRLSKSHNLGGSGKYGQKSLNRIDYLAITFDSAISIFSPGNATCFSVELIENKGYTVILDHGMGLFSEISGLDRPLISEQDMVPKGALIANYTQDSLKVLAKKKANSDITRISKTVFWRTFLTKATVNPRALIEGSTLGAKLKDISTNTSE